VNSCTLYSSSVSSVVEVFVLRFARVLRSCRASEMPHEQPRCVRITPGAKSVSGRTLPKVEASTVGLGNR
jgi:hypothetical protein